MCSGVSESRSGRRRMCNSPAGSPGSRAWRAEGPRRAPVRQSCRRRAASACSRSTQAGLKSNRSSARASRQLSTRPAVAGTAAQCARRSSAHAALTSGMSSIDSACCVCGGGWGEGREGSAGAVRWLLAGALGGPGKAGKPRVLAVQQQNSAQRSAACTACAAQQAHPRHVDSLRLRLAPLAQLVALALEAHDEAPLWLPSAQLPHVGGALRGQLHVGAARRRNGEGGGDGWVGRLQPGGQSRGRRHGHGQQLSS